MNIHDWTRVFPGTFHDFHLSWVAELMKALNTGVLPPDYYAMIELHAGELVHDAQNLSRRRVGGVDLPAGAVALAEAPPMVDTIADEATTYRLARRTLAIRHRTNRRLVAMIEILSPGNKAGEQNLEQFVNKATETLREGIHLLIVDLFPAGNWDPQGIHGEIWDIVGGRGFVLPDDRRLTFAAYMAERSPEAFVDPSAVGRPIPEMPLYLAPGWYVNVPLGKTYGEAYQGLPAIMRGILEGREPPEWEQTQ